MSLAALDLDLPIRLGRQPRLVVALEGADGLISFS
jgi:hypothetical protein